MAYCPKELFGSVLLLLTLNGDSKWQCTLGVEGAPGPRRAVDAEAECLCHLASAQRIQRGCVIGMLVPAVTSVPPSLSQPRNVVRQLCVQKTHRSGEAMADSKSRFSFTFFLNLASAFLQHREQLSLSGDHLFKQPFPCLHLDCFP